MKRVYISGRITGEDLFCVVTKFDTAETLLRDQGFFPVNPLKNGLSNIATWNQHMVRDIELLLTCDAICLLPDWQQSPGARIEAFIANEKEMPKVYLPDNINKQPKNLTLDR